MLFALPPVLRGFIALLISGACFPLCGVMVLRLNLVPLRYMLMHGVILGGAVALAFSLPLVPVTVLINVLLVCAMVLYTKDSSFGFGGASAASMVLSMALASLVMHVKDVPAKDALNLLWGSPFALTKTDVAILLLLSILLIVYIINNFKTIIALFYNQEIAFSLGINVRAHYAGMVLLIALVIALAMKLLGAFLIDALLVLPVLAAASFLQRSNKLHGIKNLFIVSGILGFFFTLAGYVLAVVCNLPPGAVIAFIAGIIYVVSIIVNRKGCPF
ncbi:MAG: metal ABC transporter permease [Treponema sp.]|nr:metal ABC transporter permease [Treponema sp.]